MEDPVNLIGTMEIMAAECDGGIGNFFWSVLVYLVNILIQYVSHSDEKLTRCDSRDQME